VLRSPHGTPLCNLHLSIAERMGARLDRFGDSSGRVALG
jgi:hypothetical protein